MSGVHRFRSMGCEIVVAASAAEAAAVRALFDADDRRFTRFSTGSELARVNATPGPLLVSARFARALRAALNALRQTGGLVDPTLLDAIEAAGYDRDFAELPADGQAPAGAPGGRGFDLTLTGRLLVRPDGIRVDLGGVVKAMAVDDAVAAIEHGWVSAGGDLATTRPVDVALPGGGAVRLERGGLATSGSARRRWRRGGQLQHHLIDPRSGRPAESPWEQVTVSGGSCLMADVAAKAAFLLAERGPGWLDARGMPGRFLRPDGTVQVNDSWRRAVAPAADVGPAAPTPTEVACT